MGVPEGELINRLFVDEGRVTRMENYFEQDEDAARRGVLAD
jgi:hypothetical protein